MAGCFVCSFIDDAIIRRIPGLCSVHLDFHDLLFSPTYVKSHDLHLNLYTIPFTCVSVGLSFGLRNTFPNRSTFVRPRHQLCCLIS